jgi:hypothetical protein
MTSEWITRLVDNERKGDALRAGEVEAAARKADFVLRHGPRLINELYTIVTHDVDAFRLEFPGDQDRDLIAAGEAEGGFTVRKPGYPSVSLSVAPHWEAAVVGCRYRFTPSSGLAVREDRFELVFTPHGDDEARFKHNNSGQVFPTTEALSEYLLTPVFTGRPR